MESDTESSRTLASIQVINNIKRHTDADSLEIATVLGWKVIVRLNETTIGSKVIYCEIDSLLPIDAPWLPPSIKNKIIRDNITGYFHVKTMKIRRKLSQGLIIPLTGEESNHLPQLDYSSLPEGYDLTDILGIKKIECTEMTDLVSILKYQFPSHLINKTEEIRLQSQPDLLSKLHNKPYYITVKMDGTSASYLLDQNKLIVCSRNLSREPPTGDYSPHNDPYWYIAEKYNMKKILETYPMLAIQGEICGPFINKNLPGLQTIDFFLFNIIDIRTKTPLSFEETSVISRKMGLKMVPLEEKGENFTYINVDSLLEKSRGLYKNTKNHREGIVVRSLDCSISFKVINNDYLLKMGW